MTIIVDAFGGDNAPLEILKGCAEAVQKFDVDILLTGKADTIKKVAAENNISPESAEWPGLDLVRNGMAALNTISLRKYAPMMQKE